MKRASPAWRAEILKPMFKSGRNVSLIASNESSVSSNTSLVMSLVRPTLWARSRKSPGERHSPSSSRQRISTSSESTTPERKSTLGWNAQPMRRSRIAARRLASSRPRFNCARSISGSKARARAPASRRASASAARALRQMPSAETSSRGHTLKPALAEAKISTPSMKKGSARRATMRPTASR